MRAPKSHKSFRPITSATLRLNYMYSVARYGRNVTETEPFPFHVVNVALHVVATGLCVPTTQYAFQDFDQSDLVRTDLAD